MKANHWLLRPSTSVAFAVAFVVIAYASGGLKAAEGASLGTIAGIGGVGGLWMLVRLAGRSSSGEQVGFIEISVAMFAFMAKWLLIAALLGFSTQIGAPAPSWLILGTLLVYSRLIGQALVS